MATVAETCKACKFMKLVKNTGGNIHVPGCPAATEPSSSPAPSVPVLANPPTATLPAVSFTATAAPTAQNKAPVAPGVVVTAPKSSAVPAELGDSVDEGFFVPEQRWGDVMSEFGDDPDIRQLLATTSDQKEILKLVVEQNIELKGRLDQTEQRAVRLESMVERLLMHLCPAYKPPEAVKTRAKKPGGVNVYTHDPAAHPCQSRNKSSQCGGKTKLITPKSRPDGKTFDPWYCCWACNDANNKARTAGKGK